MHGRSRRYATMVAMVMWLVAVPAARADEQVAAAGQVQATFSFSEAEYAYEDFRLTIDRAGQRLFDAPLDCLACTPAGIFEKRKAVHVRDLDGDAEPEVWVDFYTGGAHCCIVSETLRFTGAGYEQRSRDWWDTGYRLVDLDGDEIPEFKSRSAAFKYAFAPFSGSPFPIQVFTYRAGVFTDVTADYRALVRKDAERFLLRYRRWVRRGAPALGMLVGWVADQYVLGHRKRAHRFLSRELRAGHLRAHDGWKSGRAFIRQLRRHLRNFWIASAASAAPATTYLTATVAGGRIVIANGDGSRRRVLGSGGESSLSPDGTWVAVRDFSETEAGAMNRVELFASTGGAPAHVLSIECYGVYWSPDSTRLACVDRATRPNRLLVIDAASAATTTLASGNIDSRVSFSPDSARLAYAHRGALKVIDLATRATMTVRRRRAAAPVWGPRRIAFSTVKPRGRFLRTLNVAVVKPDGSGFRRLTRFRPRFFQSGLSPVAWSADGRRLLAGLSGQDTWVAYAVDPRRGGARRLSTLMTPSALSRDGRFVIGSTDTESFEPEASNVVRVPWAGGRPRILLRRADDPSYNG